MITVLSVAFVDDAGICAIAILEAEGVLAHARQKVARLDLSTTQSMSAEVGWTSPLLSLSLSKRRACHVFTARVGP